MGVFRVQIGNLNEGIHDLSQNVLDVAHVTTAAAGRVPEKTIPPNEPKSPSLVSVPLNPGYTIEGIPSSVVVFYTKTSEALQRKLFTSFQNTIGKLGEMYFVKNPYGNRAQTEASIVYVGTDSKDMSECAKFVRSDVIHAEPNLEKSLRVFDVSENERPFMPPYEDGITSVWKLNGLTNGPHSVETFFGLSETGVPVRDIAARGQGMFPPSENRGHQRNKRVVWVYLP